MDMTYVKVYKDWTEATVKLKDAEKGRLIDAMVVYATTGGDLSDTLSGNEQYLFPMFRAIIDRDRQALADYSKKQSENGSKGGRPKKPTAFPENPKKPPVFSETQKSQDKEKEIIPPISPKGEADEGFAAFWAEYPRHTAKAVAVKSWQKINPDASLQESIMDGLRRQKASVQWQRDCGKYIPHPSTWLNQRRWEDETETVQQEMPAQQIRWID